MEVHREQLVQEDVSFGLSVITSVHLSHEVEDYFTFIMTWIADPLGFIFFLLNLLFGKGVVVLMNQII